jgi:hypothetical protein
MANEANELQKAAACLALELPESVHRDFMSKLSAYTEANDREAAETQKAYNRATLIASRLMSGPTDGEVTRAHREAAVRVMFPQAGPESWLWKWVESGDDDEPGDKFPTARIAQALCSAESRGFAAGRASVTAKTEGWIRCEERMPEPYKLVQFHVDGWPHPDARFAGRWDGTEWRDDTDTDSDGIPELYADEQVTWWRPLPLPPAPADAELKGET